MSSRKTHPAARALSGLLILGSLGTVFLDWIGINFISLRLSFFQAIQEAVDDSLGDDSMETLVIILGAALALTGLIALICCFTGAKGGVLPHLLVSAAVLGLAVYLVDEAKREAFGFGVASIGPGAWLCPVLAVCAFLCMFIPESAPAPVPYAYSAQTAAPVGRAMSFCPHCGQKLQQGDTFCASCGSRL